MQTTFLRRPQPIFSGERATQQAKARLLSTRQLQAELARDTDPYIGSIPTRLQPESGAPNGLLSSLDALAGQLLATGLPKNTQRIIALENGLPIRLELIGGGAFGGVYRLDSRGNSYAFKLFRANPKLPAPSFLVEETGRLFRHGPYAEAATGLYLSNKQTRDLARFYIANPSARWQLSEYIDDRADVRQRPGKTLAEHGYMFQDDLKPGNNIAGIRVDYGGPLRQGPIGRIIQLGGWLLHQVMGVTS